MAQSAFTEQIGPSLQAVVGPGQQTRESKQQGGDGNDIGRESEVNRKGRGGQFDPRYPGAHQTVGNGAGKDNQRAQAEDNDRINKGLQQGGNALGGGLIGLHR